MRIRKESPKRDLLTEEKRIIVRLSERGMSYQDIEKETGVSKDSQREVLSQVGLIDSYIDSKASAEAYYKWFCKQGKWSRSCKASESAYNSLPFEEKLHRFSDAKQKVLNECKIQYAILMESISLDDIEKVTDINFLKAEIESLKEENLRLKWLLNSDEEDSSEDKEVLFSEFNATSIKELHLSHRSYNALMRAGVTTYGYLKTFSANNLLRIENIGKKSAEEIVTVAAKHGIYIS